MLLTDTVSHLPLQPHQPSFEFQVHSNEKRDGDRRATGSNNSIHHQSRRSHIRSRLSDDNKIVLSLSITLSRTRKGLTYILQYFHMVCFNMRDKKICLKVVHSQLACSKCTESAHILRSTIIFLFHTTSESHSV